MAVGQYYGDASPEETWAGLSGTDRAALVDVRTAAEWAFVGVPDLSSVGKEALRVEWQSFPSGAPNPGFADALDNALKASGIGEDDPVYFLCRSGGRSAAAAAAMTAKGYSRCLNVAGGFEGQRDELGRRGAVDGWKAAGLPWVQS